MGFCQAKKQTLASALRADRSSVATTTIVDLKSTATNALTRHARWPPCFGWWRQAGKSPHYRPILRLHAQRVFSPRKPPAPPAVPGTRPHPQATPMPCPARAHTRKPPQCRAQHAPVPQRAPHAVPSTRPHPHTTLFSAAPPVSTPGGPSRDPGP